MTSNNYYHQRPLIFCVSLLGALILALLVASGVSAQAASGRSQHPQKLPGLDNPTATAVPPIGGPFNAYDDRVDGQASDRVVVYCYSQYREIDIWGVNNDSQGIFLYAFDYDEVYAGGMAGVTAKIPDNGSLSLVVDNQGNFVVSWDGPYNYTRQGYFTKSFQCQFPGGSPTPRPGTPQAPQTRTSGYSVVYTVTPAPTATPIVTQSLY